MGSGGSDSGYGAAGGKARGAPGADAGGDPAWVASLRSFTGAAPVSSERLDVAKFFFILLVCAGHFCEPFYKVGNKTAQVFMHAIYGFHVPAFVLISGYVSGDLNPKRRRALIGGIVAPYVILHVLYSVAYTRAFCERTDGRPQCEFVNGWSLIDPKQGQWDGWDKWTFGYPFAQLWYLVSLMTKRVWRPFALEMRWTLLFHVVLGVLVGYTTVGRFLSLHRSTVHMPYFLCGFLMKKHRCFFPEARSATQKTPRTRRWRLISSPPSSRRSSSTCASRCGSSPTRTTRCTGSAGLGGRSSSSACTSGRSSRWRSRSRWCRSRSARGWCIRGEDDQGESAGLLGDAFASAAAGPGADNKPANKARTRRAGRYGRERDQDALGPRVYLRLAKWGSRTLYPFILHIAALLLVAKYTDWFEITWHVPGNEWAVTQRLLPTVVLSAIITLLLSLKPATNAFRWLLEPDITALYNPELQKL